MITHGRRSFLSRVSGCSYNLPATGPLVLQPVSSPWVMTSFFLSLAPPLSPPPFFFLSPKEESGRFSRIGLKLLSGLTGPVLFFPPAWNAWTGPVEDTEQKDAVGTRDRFVAIDVPVCVRAMAGRDFPCRAASCLPAACQISLQIHTTFCPRFFFLGGGGVWSLCVCVTDGRLGVEYIASLEAFEAQAQEGLRLRN